MSNFFDVSADEEAKLEAFNEEQARAREVVPEGYYEVMLSPFIANHEDKSVQYTVDKATKQPNGGMMVNMWATITDGDYKGRKIKYSRWIKSPVGHEKEGWAIHNKKELAHLYELLNGEPYAIAGELQLSGFYDKLIIADVRHRKDVDYKTNQPIQVADITKFLKELPNAQTAKEENSLF